MIRIPFTEDFNIKEYEKQISFISSAITGYKIENRTLLVNFDDSCEAGELEQRIRRSMQGFLGKEDTGNPEVLAENKRRQNYTSRERILNGTYIKSYGDGRIAFKDKAVWLFEYFDSIFRQFALELGAQEERYPVLLPVKAYADTGYLRNSPQYSMFCCDAMEDMEVMQHLGTVETRTGKDLINPANYALSPSACFSVYESYRGQTLPENRTITLCQNVFRNEGRFNWKDFGRLRDYHVREIVFIGSREYVTTLRKRIMDKTIEYMKQSGLTGTLESSADHFIIPQMQKFKMIQMQKKLKYEWRLSVGETEKLAVASFNLHGFNFTRSFRISVNGTETVTGCVGFGLERMVLAFLSQYGLESSRWPEEVRRSERNRKNDGR